MASIPNPTTDSLKVFERWSRRVNFLSCLVPPPPPLYKPMEITLLGITGDWIWIWFSIMIKQNQSRSLFLPLLCVIRAGGPTARPGYFE